MFFYNKVGDGGSKDEDHLWAALCRGDREAFDQLFRLFYSPLFDYGIKITSDAEIVKDGIQELFLRLWKRHTSLSQAQSVKTYLLFSLRRILLRQIKQRKKSLERNQEYLDETFSETFSMEELIIRTELEEEQKRKLVKAINHLNSRPKETLFLRYYYGLDNEEIAEVLGINKQSVRNNLFRAIRCLRTIVQAAPLCE